jgi:hypothetical protein
MDCFAEPVIGRAFARPVGSQMTVKIRVLCVYLNIVMPGLVPGIHVFAVLETKQVVDSRA